MKAKKLFVNLAVTIVSAIVVTLVMFWPFLRSVCSVKEIEDGLYYMEFKGNDGFDKFLDKGGASNSAELAQYITKFLSRGFSKAPAAEPQSSDFGCSTIVGRTVDENAIMGRNFDWTESTAIIMHCKPKGGYEYYSVFNARLLGFGDEWRPNTFANKYVALSTLFCALDGINERGLAIADLMAGDYVETHQDNGGPDLTTSSAVKFLLSHAGSVEEALYLLQIIDMHSDAGMAHHYAMSDMYGRNVVVEYIDGELYFTDVPVVTNHYLCGSKINVGKLPGDDRHEKLLEHYISHYGLFTEDDMMSALQSVWQYPGDPENPIATRWTEIFDNTDRTMLFVWNRNEEVRYRFKMDAKRK